MGEDSLAPLPPAPKPVSVWASPSEVSVPKDTHCSVPPAKWHPACFSRVSALLGYVVRGDAFMKQTRVLFCNICKLHVGFEMECESSVHFTLQPWL